MRSSRRAHRRGVRRSAGTYAAASAARQDLPAASSRSGHAPRPTPETPAAVACAPAAPPMPEPDAPSAGAPDTAWPAPGPKGPPPARPDGSRRTAPPSTPTRPLPRPVISVATNHDHPGGATSGCYTLRRVARVGPNQTGTPGPNQTRTATHREGSRSAHPIAPHPHRPRPTEYATRRPSAHPLPQALAIQLHRAPAGEPKQPHNWPPPADLGCWLMLESHGREPRSAGSARPRHGAQYVTGATLTSATSAHLNRDWTRLLVTESDERFAAIVCGALRDTCGCVRPRDSQ